MLCQSIVQQKKKARKDIQEIRVFMLAAALRPYSHSIRPMHIDMQQSIVLEPTRLLYYDIAISSMEQLSLQAKRTFRVTKQRLKIASSSARTSWIAATTTTAITSKVIGSRNAISRIATTRSVRAGGAWIVILRHRSREHFEYAK
jgi:hypothetical protein